MYWVLLCLSSGTDLKKSRYVLKSLSLCNKVLSYLILSLSLCPHPLSLSHSFSFCLSVCTSVSVSLPLCLSLCLCLCLSLSLSLSLSLYIYIYIYTHTHLYIGSIPFWGCTPCIPVAMGCVYVGVYMVWMMTLVEMFVSFLFLGQIAYTAQWV